MTKPDPSRELKKQHEPAVIRRRLNAPPGPSHLGDAVLGGIDGCVTTFAVVAGAAGGGLPDSVIVLMGFANLVGDGFSMAASNYLNVKSRREEVHKARKEEERHIAQIPQGEREEIRQIFRKKGFNGDILEKVVEVITRDDELWIQTMLTEEHGLQLEDRRPWQAALATFAAFMAVGLTPLLPFTIPGLATGHELAASAGMTALAFLGVGIFKGYVLRAPVMRSGMETLAIGGTAAALAYATGLLLSRMHGRG